ncbi:DUF6639 family protein [Roseicyclus persicicus]|uniref:Uncharacterized protein n=1 Tax=Roseicyclus persicicus TaxID=2650661 RepID=A0A7X6H0G6_9RHOB|nr:DUF6639 family protein [Roseibacterium persicicum]NKX45752.1 hypothetical protein [Roseibacterium persicicum]
MPLPRLSRTIPLLVALIGVGPAAADDIACPGAAVTIRGAAPEIAARLCDSAGTAIAGLTACGLSQRRPITVEVVPVVYHPFAICLAAFDCDYDRVRLVLRDDYAGLVAEDDPYALLPPDRLVAALLSHELAHALVWQTAEGRAVPLVDHEYIAAAMELEGMAPETRQTVLDATGLTGADEGRVNIRTYRLEPRRFAANAWLHFREDGNGCALIAGLVAGTRSFEPGSK